MRRDTDNGGEPAAWARPALRWSDRVYGDVVLDDPLILALIDCPTFRRLEGIKQAGPSALAFPFKDVTRREHSLGVHVLLRRLGADRREQVAGLLHDISHTAFSHAVDFVFDSEEQDHHEDLKPLFLDRPDIASALARLGFKPDEFYDDSVYPLLERPLPELCADRLDYFLRDGRACGVVDPDFARRVLDALVVEERSIALNDARIARAVVERFAVMNRDWWASPTEGYIYNEFANALRAGLDSGIITRADLFADDAHVLGRLEASGLPAILTPLGHIRDFHPGRLRGYRPRVIPKERWLDPPVAAAGALQPLSRLEGRA